MDKLALVDHVLAMRFAPQPFTVAEVAERLGITRAEVREIESRHRRGE